MICPRPWLGFYAGEVRLLLYDAIHHNGSVFNANAAVYDVVPSINAIHLEDT